MAVDALLGTASAGCGKTRCLLVRLFTVFSLRLNQTQSVVYMYVAATPALTTPPSQRTAPLPPVNTSTEYSLSESTQLRMGSAFAREREERLPCSLHPAHRVIHAARCPILLGGIVIGNQAGGFARGRVC
jgi:hypothetical protein